MRLYMCAVVLGLLAVSWPVSAAADHIDLLFSKAQQESCGLIKLTATERERLAHSLVALYVANAPERAARLYCENELGLTGEVTVESIHGAFLILDSGAVLRMFDATGFSPGSTYLADDDTAPTQVLDDDGELEDVSQLYPDIEEALDDQ